ncbi:hypothetical protein IH982_00280 [Patescibacteria group bacterium]|nr:hypothetical protein [Patescibacteria group bacterium]
MNQELHSFVKESLGSKQNRAAIKEALLSAGWQEQEITKALNSFAEVDFPIPVPKKKPYLAAREAFLYLVSFITLYISAFSFGALVFSFIDIWFPDPLRFGGGVPRTAIASLIVAFPIFLVITRALHKGAAKDPERKESKVKKWLTYLTLVIAAGVLIGDLITVLSSLLGGELSMRFFLKALTVFIVAGSIFGYYLSDLQKEEKES